jgi:hypothetical protein
LIFLRVKTIADLPFTNLFVGGSSSWQNSDIQNIDTALAAAMSDVVLNNVMDAVFRIDFAALTVEVAGDLYGANSAEENAVWEAWSEVGLNV